MEHSRLLAAIACANSTLDALRHACGKTILPGQSGEDLLRERAVLMQWQAQGQCSANGSCHLLRCHDGWVAINLSREDDWQLLPALLGQNETIGSLDELQHWLITRHTDELIERGALLGLALAAAIQQPCNTTPACKVILHGNSRQQRSAQPKVLDLSSLWAGPLCSRLLQHAGAQVTEIDSVTRPDGMKLNTAPGAQTFYEQLHAGKSTVTLDFRKTDNLQRLRQLITEADIVIEGSRPRALQQLGIDVETLVQQQPGLVWVSITGYGRGEAQANRIAYGDDAAMGAGLFDERDGKPVFIGDAIADPLTGIHAALAAWTHWKEGRAVLLDVNLHAVARVAASFRVA